MGPRGPLIDISVFVPGPYCLDDCGFVVEPEVRQVDSSSSILLSQDCFGYSSWVEEPGRLQSMGSLSRTRTPTVNWRATSCTPCWWTTAATATWASTPTWLKQEPLGPVHFGLMGVSRGCQGSLSSGMSFQSCLPAPHPLSYVVGKAEMKYGSLEGHAFVKGYYIQLVQQAQISVHMHVHLKGGRICVPANVQIGGTWLEELGLYLFICLAR